jgi:hypothetical protein
MKRKKSGKGLAIPHSEPERLDSYHKVFFTLIQ